MTSPDHPTPDKAQSAAALGPFYQNANQDSLGAADNSEMNNLLAVMQDNFFVKILGGFLSVVGAVGDGITSVVEAITGILGGTLGDLDQWSNDIVDGQIALNGQVDLLSPLQDYGSCFANGVEGIVNTGKVPFNQQIGPMTGCHLASSGIVLDDKGLWDIRGRVWFSFTASPISGVINWEIRVVKDSDGSTFSVQRDQVRDTDVNSREINTSVVIPAAGYRAEIWITNLAPGRAVWGGAAYNRFTVQHITRSTQFPI